MHWALDSKLGLYIRPSLKFCKFAVPRPTRENRRDPNFFIAISDLFFFFFRGAETTVNPILILSVADSKIPFRLILIAQALNAFDYLVFQ